LADSSRENVVARLLITSGAALNHNAHNTVNGQEKPVSLVLAEHLRNTRITWPSSLKALLSVQTRSTEPYERKTPREHQELAIAAVTEGFTKGKVSRGQLLMACGTGKTFVGQQVAEEINAKTVLLLFPSLMLLGQTLNDWAADASDGKGFDWLAVCSDETVTRTDEAIQHVQDLGITNVTTNPEHIRSFLTRERRSGVPLKVIFSTYQSTDRIAEAIKGLDPFDLIICDEAHRMASINRGGKKTTPSLSPLAMSKSPLDVASS
jgi:predicted helicase